MKFSTALKYWCIFY